MFGVPGLFHLIHPSIPSNSSCMQVSASSLGFEYSVCYQGNSMTLNTCLCSWLLANSFKHTDIQTAEGWLANPHRCTPPIWHHMALIKYVNTAWNISMVHVLRLVFTEYWQNISYWNSPSWKSEAGTLSLFWRHLQKCLINILAVK